MQDVLMLCENCEVNPSISVTDDDVELCAECELALIEEMAGHEDECDCVTSEGLDNGAVCTITCPGCTCGVVARVIRREAWLREQIVKSADDGMGRQ